MSNWAKGFARRLHPDIGGRDGAACLAADHRARQRARPAPAVQLPPPPAGLARVWFLRQFQPGESLWTPMIYVNGAAMTPSTPCTIFYRDFVPERHTFTVDSPRLRYQPVPER